MFFSLASHPLYAHFLREQPTVQAVFLVLFWVLQFESFPQIDLVWIISRSGQPGKGGLVYIPGYFAIEDFALSSPSCGQGRAMHLRPDVEQKDTFSPCMRYGFHHSIFFVSVMCVAYPGTLASLLIGTALLASIDRSSESIDWFIIDSLTLPSRCELQLDRSWGCSFLICEV